MSAKRNDVESQGAKPRDHEHPRHHFWKTAHRSPWLWIVVVLMLALILVYVMTDNLSLRPGKKAAQPTPAANAP
jgi:bacteriorhodopsin